MSGTAEGVVTPRNRTGARAITRERLYILVILVVTAVLASWDLGEQSLSLDEGVTSGRMTAPADEFRLAITEWEPNFALYYVFMRGWTYLFGIGEVALRLPSVLFVVAASPLLYATLRRTFDHRVALVAMLAYGINPFVLRQAHDARPYALVLLAVALGAYLFVVTVQTGDRRAWIGWTVVSCVALYAHPFTAFATGAQMATLLAYERPGLSLRRATTSVVAIGLASIPMVRALLTAGTERIAWIPEADPEQVGTAIVVVAGGTYAWFGIYAIAWCGVVWSWWKERNAGRRESWPYLYLLGWSALPVIGLYVVSHLYVPVFLDRYLAIIVPALSGAVGVVVGRLRAGWKVGVAVAAIAVASAVPILEIYTTTWKTDWRGAARTVVRGANPGDAVILFRVGEQAFVHYYRELEPDPAIDVFTPDDVARPGAYPALLQNYERVWLVLHDHHRRPAELARLMAPLQTWDVVDEADAYEVEIRLLRSG